METGVLRTISVKVAFPATGISAEHPRPGLGLSCDDAHRRGRRGCLTVCRQNGPSSPSLPGPLSSQQQRSGRSPTTPITGTCSGFRDAPFGRRCAFFRADVVEPAAPSNDISPFSMRRLAPRRARCRELLLASPSAQDRPALRGRGLNDGACPAPLRNSDCDGFLPTAAVCLSRRPIEEKRPLQRSSGTWRQRMARWERRAAESADVTIAVSSRDEEGILRVRPRHEQWSLPNGIDSDFLHRGRTRRRGLDRDNWSLPG